ncbi:hypothetical protein D3C87_125350 [compost metagenome]
MTNPKFFIPRHVYSKVMHWVNKTDLEVSGFGKITFNQEQNYFLLSDVVLLKQEVGAVHTDIDPASLGKAMFETKDLPGDLNFWWHSHVNMAVFWSGTDKTTIEELGKQGYCLATVFNKKNEMRTALAYMAKANFGEVYHFVDEMTTIIFDHVPTEKKAEWDSEFTEKVKEKTYISPYSSQYNYKGKVEDEEEKKESGGIGGGKSVLEREASARLKAAIANWTHPEDPEYIFDTYAKWRRLRFPVWVAQTAAVLGVYCYQVNEGISTLTDEEADRLDQIVDDFCERHPIEMLSETVGS